MKQTIDIELFKENPQLLFSQLNKESEKELSNLLNYFIFKYNITINDKEYLKNEKKIKDKDDFLLFLKKGFSVSENEIQAIEQTQKEINKWEVQKF